MQRYMFQLSIFKHGKFGRVSFFFISYLSKNFSIYIDISYLNIIDISLERINFREKRKILPVGKIFAFYVEAMRTYSIVQIAIL